MANGLTPKQIFEEKIAKRLKDEPEEAAKINSVYQFDVSGPDGGTWVVNLTQSGIGVTSGADPAARCTISISDENFINMLTGKLNPQMAFMSGKLKIKGDMSLAMKLQQVLGKV
ncbi:MAG TPA: SCP2 sterol-binding domain-containing protein [bacterium]